MKVNDPNMNSIPPDTIGRSELDKAQQTEQLRKNGTSDKTDTSFQESPDSVTLSDLSGRLRELNIDGAERTERINKLGEDVDAGRYEVNSLELSRRLIDYAMRSEL